MNPTLLYKTATAEFRGRWIEYTYGLQETICAGLAKADGKAVFVTDEWERAGGTGGGGRTKVLENGKVFEKAGVNTSVVYGHVTGRMRKQLQIEGHSWFACGLSLVIHPLNPYVPTVHANWRFFELYNEEGYVTDRWFGGGSDLTPYYLFVEDAIHFHQTLKNVLDSFDSKLYPLYKKNCDEYFSNTHRNNERRGIGGIFYDHLRPTEEVNAENLLTFQQRNGNAFLETYLPIVNKRKEITYGEKEIFWQEIRRGRYVEFNLIHDRGTLFGLKTKGRAESILMSLPPRARWAYGYQPDPGTREDELVQLCLSPREWV